MNISIPSKHLECYREKNFLPETRNNSAAGRAGDIPTTFLLIIAVMLLQFLSAQLFPVCSKPSSPPIPFSIIKHLYGTVDSTDSDSIAYKTCKQYMDWRSQTCRCSILKDSVKQNGIIVYPGELEPLLRAHDKAFPGIPIDTMRLKNIFRTQKYLMQSLRIYPTAQQLEECYRRFIDESPHHPLPPQRDIDPILTSSFVFTTDTAIQLCEEIKKARRLKYLERLQSRKTPWPHNRLTLDAAPDSCLVYVPDCDSCLITIGAFNRYLSLFPMRRSLRRTDARKRILHNLLNILYYSGKAIDEGLHYREDLIEKELVRVNSNRLFRINPLYSPEDIDQTKLEAIYDKYYDRFFRKQITRVYQIIASSDSSYIDSLHHNLCSVSVAGSFTERKAYFRSLPWLMIASDELPDTVAAMMDTLRIQEFAMINTPFGYFICRFVHNEKRDEIPFSSARVQCIDLLQQEQLRKKSLPDSVKALRYYNKNRKRFISPDTLLVTAWLFPDDGVTSDPQDTLRFSSLPVSSVTLPVEIRDTLFKIIEDNDRPSDHIGPLYSNYGIWYFKNSKVLPGGGEIPYASVKNEILRKITNIHLSFDSTLSTRDGAEMNRTIALAAIYRKYYRKAIERSVENISDEMVLQMIGSGEIRVGKIDTTKSTTHLLKRARRIVISKKINKMYQDANTWRKSLYINKERLYSGCMDLAKKNR